MIPIDEQPEIARHFKSKGGVLITEFVAPDDENKGTVWHVLYLLPDEGMVSVQSLLNSRRCALLDLSDIFPVATRLQRAIYDLTKIPTRRAKDRRSWLNHGYFPIGMLNTTIKHTQYTGQTYSFDRVSGNGVHEIPVGPVHAGVIEPGHFRFSVVGERILKLEEYFGYTHKGIHKLLLGKDIAQGAKLISRISGDSTVAYAYAYALACEAALKTNVDARTQVMRAILLERERLANHVGDIGAIINDAGFPSLQSQFSILKETFLRENAELTGHRYLMDVILPCKLIPLWQESEVNKVLATLNDLSDNLAELKAICTHHHGLQDRLKTTGILSNHSAIKLGVIGFVAKASGVATDARQISYQYPYNEIDFIPLTETKGDVAARLNLRFRECEQSIQLVQKLLALAPIFKNSKEQVRGEHENCGLGMVEGWRGPISVAVKLQADQISWCHFHDPSWQNWPALEYAVIGDIVADFPLINKSFNLSYSGQDC